MTEPVICLSLVPYIRATHNVTDVYIYQKG